MAFKMFCPNCGAVYQLIDQVAGRKVRCKVCEQVFTARPEEGGFTEVKPIDDDRPRRTSTPPPPPSRPHFESAKLPRVRRGKRPRVDVSSRPFPWPLLVGGIVTGLVLLVGLAVVAAWLLTRAPIPPVADASPVADAVPAKAPEERRAAAVAPAKGLEGAPVVAQRPPFRDPAPPAPDGRLPVKRAPVVFPPPVPVVLKPPDLEQEKVVRLLPAPLDDVAVGGGGRYLILHLPGPRQLAVFDV